VTTLAGVEIPLRSTSLGSEEPHPPPAASTVSRLATISPPSATAPIRAASWTPFPP
jgi:hypothetical protein